MVIDKPDFEDIRHILEAMADALLDEQQDEVAQFILVSAYFCFYFFLQQETSWVLCNLSVQTNGIEQRAFEHHLNCG